MDSMSFEQRNLFLPTADGPDGDDGENSISEIGSSGILSRKIFSCGCFSEVLIRHLNLKKADHFIGEVDGE